METDSPQVDHVIPKSRGGNATPENAQTTCGWRNRSKGNRNYPINPPPGYTGPWPPDQLVGMMASERIAVHQNPVWRNRSDFIIRAQIEGEEGRFEQLWAKKVKGNLFDICCIPFFLYGVALGDRVSTDNQYVVERVVQRFGRRAFRVWFGNVENPIREAVAEEMQSLGLLAEWSSRNLLAIDAVDELCANAAVERLSDRQSSGELMFEDAG